MYVFLENLGLRGFLYFEVNYWGALNCQYSQIGPIKPYHADFLEFPGNFAYFMLFSAFYALSETWSSISSIDISAPRCRN